MPTEQKARKPTRVTCVHGELSGGLSHQQVVPGDGPTGVGGSLHRNFPTRIVDKSIILGRSEDGRKETDKRRKVGRAHREPREEGKNLFDAGLLWASPQWVGSRIGEGR